MATTTTILVGRSHARAEANRFNQLVASATDELCERMLLYQYGARGARGLFAASTFVDRSEFLEYFQSRDYKQEFPGALGIGYIHRVARADIDDFVRSRRETDDPEFEFKTVGSAPDLHVIQYLEPRESNAAAIGYDVGSEPVRREAATAAMRSGRGTITARIELVQMLGEVGFLYYMPVYRRGSNPTTPEARERDLVGWTYLPLVASRILDDMFVRVDGLVAYAAYDGPQKSPEAVLHDGISGLPGEGPAFECTVPISVADRTWTLHFASTPKFESSPSRSPITASALVGGTVTALLSLLAWSIC